jgi:hypothetical protein
MRRAIFAVTSGVLGLATIYCILWVFSSASLACTACDCSYSLFHDSPRCRQPYYAMLGAAFTGLGAIACLVLAIRSKPKRANNAT